ncbi:unnamed protein product [Mytilus edulis]|uniref:Uncharacterized protein n=1 Tax=Mytilus edulis TaxID=6550 RepID=A0A8S3VHB1_MYTED|nr:unnamed protein product [Mytilus edulis]
MYLTQVRDQETVDSIYETIDESNILDINISTDLQVMYDESGNPSGIDDEHELHAGSNNDSYETPLSDTNVHTNSTAVNNPSTSSSFSSVSGGSGYLNPYQPIVFDVDIHKYSTTCGVKERVDTIGYEADKSVPDKLNPYQSFFSVTNNQNYNSIIIQDGMETSVHIIGEKGEIFDQSTVSSKCDSKTSSTNKSKASFEFHRSETETVNLKMSIKKTKTNTNVTQKKFDRSSDWPVGK